MSDPISLMIALVGGLTLGHAPALFARYGWKKAPLSLATAFAIASIGCIALVFAVVAANETFGVPQHARSWASWIGVSSVTSIVTMVRGKREHLIPKLRAMIADPATTEEHRALAAEKLVQLEAISAKRTRTPPRSIANHPPAQRGERNGHSQRLGQHGDESDDASYA